MSLRKKRPGNKWVTGLPNAQMQKTIVLLRSILAQDAKLAPFQAQLSPLTDADRTDFNKVITDCEDLVIMRS
jgi:hypothetical protein